MRKTLPFTFSPVLMTSCYIEKIPGSPRVYISRSGEPGDEASESKACRSCRCKYKQWRRKDFLIGGQHSLKLHILRVWAIYITIHENEGRSARGSGDSGLTPPSAERWGRLQLNATCSNSSPLSLCSPWSADPLIRVFQTPKSEGLFQALLRVGKLPEWLGTH